MTCRFREVRAAERLLASIGLFVDLRKVWFSGGVSFIIKPALATGRRS